MPSRRLAVIALLLIPAIAGAQRRQRGDEARWKEMNKTPAGPRFNDRDIERFSAVKMIVEKRKDLKLTDDQAKQFKDLDKKEEDGTRGLFRTLDSLRNAMRPRAGSPEDEERARMTLAREEAMRVIAAIRASYDSTLKNALPLLDESQRKSAGDLVQKGRADAEEELKEKLGGARP